MTVLSKPTLEILKNFCSINKSLVINPGNKLSTLSINKNILVYADVEESFDSQLSIYDLGVFLGGLSLFEQPSIDTSRDNYVTVSDTKGRSKTKFFYADPDIITQPPEKEINLPSEDVKFRLESTALQQLQRAASVYQLPDLCLFGDGEKMNLCLTDKKNDTSTTYSIEVGKSDDEFCYCFKVENLKLLLGDYNVTLSKSNVALFQGEGIKYFIALEPNA